MTLKYRSVPAAARSRGADRPLTRSFRSSDIGVDHRAESRSWRISPDSRGSNETPIDPSRASSGVEGESSLRSRRSALPAVIDAFTEAWERGSSPIAEDYLDHLDPADSEGAVELIYREYCLAESDGRSPDRSHYFARFPRHREGLERLLRMHGACPTSLLGRWFAPMAEDSVLPEAGDSIGPYLLRRELGRGGFARVFLAEEADLENRQVVVKVSTRATREPWLLARVRHANIVEIVSHALVNDGAFQLICMPFFGGATLESVLAERRGQARAAASGLDLLADLDRVSAPEYPGSQAARPAREILARLSYDRAIAWIIARLADALGHAFGRDVAHGDVKPSNILLSAGGNPMLLDFNLARDSAPTLDGPALGADPGGTLAYMAPERLRAIAGAEPTRAVLSADESGPGSDSDVAASLGERAPHLADLYSLGMVLLEALTGRPPLSIKEPDRKGAASRGALTKSAARAYASARERSARSTIRDSEIPAGRSIAPGLRVILERCLDPDPARRYGRASELADDLDRWRSDRPLAFAEEPFWGQTLPRWLRRKRRMLTVAAVSLITVGLATTAVVLSGMSLMQYRSATAGAISKLALKWDVPEAGALVYQRAQTPHSLEPDDPQAIETAHLALKDYGILGPKDDPSTGDWRVRDDVKHLPAIDRLDLETWIMERAYRYCWGLENRTRSPSDWRRALEILDRVSGPMSIPAFAPMRDRLLARLDSEPPAPPRPRARRRPHGSMSICSVSSPNANPHPPTASRRSSRRT